MKENDQDLMNLKELEQILIPHLPKCDGAFYVTGDGMYPLLKSGDLVLYKEIKVL
jgi:phage repressor protein C with HTH and peptisase S24 domain